MSLTTKQCSQCRRDLPYFMFGLETRRADGMSPHCRDCAKKYRAKDTLKRKLKNKKEVRDLSSKVPY